MFENLRKQAEPTATDAALAGDTEDPSKELRDLMRQAVHEAPEDQGQAVALFKQRLARSALINRIGMLLGQRGLEQEYRTVMAERRRTIIRQSASTWEPREGHGNGVAAMLKHGLTPYDLPLPRTGQAIGFAGRDELRAAVAYYDSQARGHKAKAKVLKAILGRVGLHANVRESLTVDELKTLLGEAWCA